MIGRLDAPFGTAENPVEVPSEFDHRVVGVPDPDDDSLVWWGIIEDGKPAKQVCARFQIDFDGTNSTLNS